MSLAAIRLPGSIRQQSDGHEQHAWKQDRSLRRLWHDRKLGQQRHFHGQYGRIVNHWRLYRKWQRQQNTLGVQDSTVNGSITGGQTGTGDAASNTVNMSGTNTTGSVYGGHVTTSGNATGNTVNFTEGSSNTSLIYGGYTSKGMAKDNHVNISGTSLNKLKLIYGGYSNAAGTGKMPEQP